MTDAHAALVYEPDDVVHPGAHLTEWLEFHGMSQAEFARRVGLSTKHINQIVNEAAGLGPDTAVAFARVTGLSPAFWSRLEAVYRAHEAVKADDERLAADVDVLKRFPIPEMVKRGYLAKAASPVEQLRHLLAFFGVANAAALDKVVLQPTALRRSRAFEPNVTALAAWLRRAELRAAAMTIAPFDAATCTEAIGELREMTRLPKLDWVDALVGRCASFGIAIVIERELPGCRINGATRWLGADKAMIALSMRHRRHDILWFTFFHELAHVLRHSRKETFIDAEGMGVPEDLERDADRFASRTLIPPEHDGELVQLASEADVLAFADRVGVSPAIVVGRMHHEKLVPPNRWQHLIPKYRFHNE